MSSSESSGSSTSFSSSTPTFVETPENQLINQLSSVAAGLAQQMNTWAQGVYQHTSQITDQAVNHFFDVSQKMSGMAGGMTDQYNNIFAPENAQLVQDANTYASEPRLRANMGMAGATQAQAGDAAIKNSEANLLSYGIDPSSGRYAALDKAAAVQNAANIAGAENLQRNQDIATGQRLRSEAVQVGSQLPAAIANANNTAIQANTGASNATLANANTGANVNSLADKYLGTAMGIKLPPTGQHSNSQSGSQQHGSSQGPGNGGGSGGGGSGGGNGGGGPAWMPNHTGYQGSGNSSAHASYGQGGSKILNTGNGGNSGAEFNDPTGNNYDMWSGSGAPDFGYMDGPQSGTGSVGDQTNPSFDYGGSNPFGDSGFGQTFDYGGPNQTYGGLPDMGNSDAGLGNISYDSAANNASPGWDNTYNTPTDTNWGDSNGAAAGGGFDNPFSPTDYSGSFAEGGEVPMGASPSGGNTTDDVRANLNAGEFVIPKDVAMWKGGEFFHNLIAKSRKLRATSPVGGRPMPAGDPRAQGAPTFQSR